MAKRKRQKIGICVHRKSLCFIQCVEKTKEVEVFWGIPYPPANHAGEVQEWKLESDLCFIVVVLVIVWGIIWGDICERGSFLKNCFSSMT